MAQRINTAERIEREKSAARSGLKFLPQRYVENVPLESLVDYPGNPKDHDTGAILESMQVNGVVDVLYVQEWPKTPRYIIAGHGRKATLESQGVTHVNCIFVKISPKAARRYVLASNRAGERGGWNDALLVDYLRNQAELGDLMGTGFDAGDVNDLIALLDPNAGSQAQAGSDLDEVPETPKVAISKTGDLIMLGRHRLICGDATDPKVWKRLLAGERAALCLTDAPYGIGLDYHTFIDTPENVAAIAKKWLPLARANADVVVFSPGVTRQWLYPEPDWVLCWFYGGGQLRSPWGFNCWQPFLCYGKDPSLATGHGCRPDAFNLNTPANAQDLDHPCPKPMQLWQALIERLSFGHTDVICDPLAGAGTTLIAAETMGRVARLIELDPLFCDVTVARWEKVTGLKATRPK